MTPVTEIKRAMRKVLTDGGGQMGVVDFRRRVLQELGARFRSAEDDKVFELRNRSPFEVVEISRRLFVRFRDGT